MGHPTADQTPIPAEVAELLAARIMRGVVEDAQGCWIRTTRRPTPSGYTHISRQVGGVRTYYYAHRVMYVAAKGAIPSGMTVDHLCENERAAREYRDHPTACARWCVECVRPCGTTKNCEHCADTRATRRRRARSKP